MPAIVGIFLFISKENFMLSWDEHEKSFMTLGLFSEKNKKNIIDLSSAEFAHTSV